ncbi:PIN-like domain-containing protein [Actinomadura monticuli]|uniref:PIN-like domain-containing protein n=1 Tax=Actinomadura monticuli TaxID=3097367 RepID=A0ABV4QPG6_9ACTN
MTSANESARTPELTKDDKDLRHDQKFTHVGDPQPGGLFDGFEAYRTPTNEDYRDVLTGGLVVVDTNVLLNLYRYNDQTRDDLLGVLRRLDERLWVPRQVMEEFWRNREAALRDPRGTSTTIDELSEHKERTIRTFQTWANRVGLPSDRRTELVGAISDAFDQVCEGVAELTDDEAAQFARNTSADPVIVGLERILQGRVGPALSDTDYQEALAEAKRRGDTKHPPGYKDSGKDPELAAGDYLVWVQLIREATRRGHDVLLVTGDVKDDWWRRERGEIRGPRRELVDELRVNAGVRLFMLRPDSLMVQARKALQVEVSDESVDDIGRVDRALADTAYGGWTTDALGEILDLLGAEGRMEQAAAIIHAAKNDGFVSRDAIYALAGYDESRSLRGFTRPITRITGIFREQGTISASAEDILTADYDDSAGSPGLAIGFSMPQSIVPLVRSLGRGVDKAPEP